MTRYLLLALLSVVSVVPFSSGQAQEVAAGATKTAVFAGGCFWCMQSPYDKAKGVIKTTVGYSGGGEKNPTYEQVADKKTGHREAIEITYDPSQISYDQLLDIFWRQIDPTQADGQFADIGLPYRAAIFYRNEEEKKAAEASKAKLGSSGKFQKPIITDLLPAAPFYVGEEYHQKYYQKNSADYQRYYVGSGRAGFLKKTWGEAKE